MGTWGTGISDNDLFADLYQTFFDMYNDGLTVKQISERLISENEDTIEDPDDGNNFWFALAQAQWDCNQLDDELLERIKHIIESRSDITVWRNLGADEDDIKERQEVLTMFLSKLQSKKS